MAKSKRGSDKYSVRIPKGLQETMIKRCKKDGITPSKLIRKALGLYLFGIDCEEERIISDK